MYKLKLSGSMLQMAAIVRFPFQNTGNRKCLILYQQSRAMSLFVYQRNCVVFVSIDQEKYKKYDLVYKVTYCMKSHTLTLYCYPIYVISLHL